MNNQTEDPQLDNLQLDNQMSDLTDAVLAGREPYSSADRELALIVQQLAKLTKPEPTTTDFRNRLTAKLSEEFDLVRGLRTSRTRRPVIQLWSMLAAAALIVVVGGAALANQVQTNPTVGVVGTTIGDAPILPILGVGAGIVVVVAVALFFWQRRR